MLSGSRWPSGATRRPRPGGRPSWRSKASAWPFRRLRRPSGCSSLPQSGMPATGWRGTGSACSTTTLSALTTPERIAAAGPCESQSAVTTLAWPSRKPSWRRSRPTGTMSSTSAPSRPIRWTIRTTPGRSARRCSGASWTRACSSAPAGPAGGSPPTKCRGPPPPGGPGPPPPPPAARPAAPVVTTPPLVLPDPLKLPAVEETLRFLEQHEFLDRLWVKDATLWKGEAATVRNRLGWLTSPTIMRSHAEDIRTFADEIRRLQYSQVIVLGMGGSSLTGEVLNETFGSKMGFPDMLVLDSTDPGAVKQILDTFHLSRALFVVSSKSGTTAETLAAYSFFRGQVEAAASPRPGMQFVAITDPGRPLDQLATETGFRRTFLNPASIGGRFFPLPFFGLVPAPPVRLDIQNLLPRAPRTGARGGHQGGVRAQPPA